MEWGIEYIGFALLGFGIFLGFKWRKRKFERMNKFGVEQFSNYWGKVRAKIKDGLMRGLSLYFSAAGVLLLAFRYQDSWGSIVLLPVCIFMIFVLI